MKPGEVGDRAHEFLCLQVATARSVGWLRRSLFAAALPAAFHWNKVLIDLYRRLTARGKAHNAELIACARKLLIYANTIVYRGTPWVERTAAT